MKRFEELVLREPTDPEYLEERLLRKGAGLLFAAQSKSRGDRAVQHFKTAQGLLNTNAGASTDQRVESLSRSFDEMCNGLIELRHQNGAITALSLSAVLLGEKSHTSSRRRK